MRIQKVCNASFEQFDAGHESFQVHAFPFRMTAENMARHRSSQWYPFWQTLKEGYDHFEVARQPPQVAVCERRYVVNPQFRDADVGKLDAAGRCPAYVRNAPQAFVPRPNDKVAMMPQVVVPGLKKRDQMMSAIPAYGRRMSLGMEAGAVQGEVPAGNR